MFAIASEPLVGIAFGVIAIVLGIATTRGSFRRWEPWYRDPEMPWFLRNGAFALTPFGIAILGLIGAALTSGEKKASAVFVHSAPDVGEPSLDRDVFDFRAGWQVADLCQ